MTDSNDSFLNFLDLLQVNLFNLLSPESIQDDYKEIISDLSKYNPYVVSAIVGSLLTLPELQANCIRIEVLVHLALIHCKGKDIPDSGAISQWFQGLGDGICGRMEDPSEDVFISIVADESHNYRVFEGIFCSSTFYLQRFLNIISQMPKKDLFLKLRSSVKSLLKLSEEVAERSNLKRYTVGNEIPINDLPDNIIDKISCLSDRIIFTVEDLKRLNIEITELLPFVLDLSDWNKLSNENPGNTSLERQPILFDKENIILVLPSTVSVAIRHYVIKFCHEHKLLSSLEMALVSEYKDLFFSEGILHKDFRYSLHLPQHPNGLSSSLLISVDEGTFFHLIMWIDNLDDYESNGMTGVNLDVEQTSKIFTGYIKTAQKIAQGNENFIEGITLIAHCGWGRSMNLMIEEVNRSKWRVESLGADDILTLNWLPDFDILTLLRILKSRDLVTAAGFHLMNVNGLLNLIAWSRSLDGHLIPHDQLPNNMIGGGMIHINQNSILEARKEALHSWDPHILTDPQNRATKVSRKSLPYFADDKNKPLYASKDDLIKGRLRAVYITPARTWWVEVTVPDDTHQSYKFELWHMASFWLLRSASVMDKMIENLPDGSIEWQLLFENIISEERVYENLTENLNFDDLCDLTIEKENRKIILKVKEAFDYACSFPENFAESALVNAFVKGVSSLCNHSCEIEEITQEIIQSPDVRHLHRFHVQDFRDCVHESIPEVIFINRTDDAMMRLGLGWKVHDPKDGAWIKGIEPCTTFLNSIVTQLENELCTEIRSFNRSILIQKLFLNYEAAIKDRYLWRRTSKAVIAIYKDTEETLEKISEREFEINAVCLACRILIEITRCEASLNGGLAPGELDISLLMAKASLLTHLGGYSDAIHWQALKPEIHISPLGDIEINTGFIDNVIMPLGYTRASELIRNSAERYQEIFQIPEASQVVLEDLLDANFISAWEEEFGADINQFRKFVVFTEDEGNKRGKAVFSMRRSELMDMLIKQNILDENSANSILEMLTLPSTIAWKTLPDKFLNKDRFPWRFRRCLSIMRRPLVATENNNDPFIFIVPGVIRDSLLYLLDNHNLGTFDQRQMRSKSMKRWIGSSTDRRGHLFNKKVSSRLQELGWNVRFDLNITELLKQSFDKNYGDIDVFAWRDNGRVLFIECKDLQVARTHGEIAEQLYRFRGDYDQKGKPDLLRKHLDRLAIGENNLKFIKKYTKLLDLKIEGYLVFSDTVPLQFAKEHMTAFTKLETFNTLVNI